MIEKTHIDLFTGLAGFSFAAAANGIRTVVQCEADPHRRAFLEATWSQSENRPSSAHSLTTHLMRVWPTAWQSDGNKGIRTAEGREKERQRRQNGEDLPTTLGTIMNGSPAPTVPFAAFQLVFTAWLMGYSLEYLAKFGQRLSQHSEIQSCGQSRQKSSEQ